MSTVCWRTGTWASTITTSFRWRFCFGSSAWQRVEDSSDPGTENQGLLPRRCAFRMWCVFSREAPIEQVFARPQLIAIEVLSPEDRRSRIEARMNNLREFGVPNLWVVDPATRSGWDLSDGNWVNKERFEVAGSPIYLSLPELFAKIDEDNAD